LKKEYSGVLHGETENRYMIERIADTIQNVLAGDIDAYEEIVQEYQEEIRRIAAFTLHDISATEDFVQEVFVRAYRSLETYDAGRDFGAWLRTIARNLLRNEIRRAVREKKAFRSYRKFLLKRLEHNEKAEQYEIRLAQALEQCREHMEGDAERALDLRYDKGLDFAEVADALNRTVAAARQLLTRVRKALRRCVEERMGSL